MNDTIETIRGEEKALRDAQAIFLSALARVDPALMVQGAVRVVDGTIKFSTELEKAAYRLADYDRIVVAGFGKAGASMARGLEEALAGTAAEPLLEGGAVAVKKGHLDRLAKITLFEASHPVPDASSVAAAKAVLALAAGVDERTLAIVLISGGGSALLCAPAPGISLEDKAATTSLLLGSGAPIQEVNCVRKHLSAVKGGRLAAAFAPATVVSLILSDVIGDDLDAIASGPTTPDPTTWADALAIVKRRGIEAALPQAVADLLNRGAAGGAGAPADTPKAEDPAFARTRNLLVGTNRLALMAAESKARGLGYSTLVLTSRLTGEAREAALMLVGIGKDIAVSGFPLPRPACLLVGGETTVTLRGKGKGGRNQEMALAFLAAMARAPKDSGGLVFLAASTDGSDGPTDAAGAFASASLLERARTAGLDPDAYLANNDSYNFFDRITGLLRTGPTNTNVCDLQILIVP